jgi:hypothetical protein
LISALDGGEWSALRLSRFTPRERALATHLIGGWVSPRAGLDAVVKRKNSQLLPGLETAIIQPVAQLYTTELSRFLNKKQILRKKHPEQKQKIFKCILNSFKAIKI